MPESQTCDDSLLLGRPHKFPWSPGSVLFVPVPQGFLGTPLWNDLAAGDKRFTLACSSPPFSLWWWEIGKEGFHALGKKKKSK